MRRFTLLLCLLALTGCIGSVHRLRELNPSADDFPSALASEYQAYADSEMELNRLFSAEHYARKGLSALEGEAVEPDVPSERLTGSKRQNIEEAREQLTRLLTDDMKRIAAQKLARAQLLYDCWLHELERNIDQEKAPCSEEFQSSISELQEIADTLTSGQESNHVIAFARKSTALDEQGKAVIKAVAEQVAHMPDYRVKLVIYSGRKLKQRQLTDKRVQMVRKALVNAGVKGRNIKIKKEGGSKVVILSRDGIAMDTKKVTIMVKIHQKSKGR